MQNELSLEGEVLWTSLIHGTRKKIRVEFLFELWFEGECPYSSINEIVFIIALKQVFKTRLHSKTHN